jgi:hypothetical protein
MFLIATAIADRLSIAPHFQTWDVRSGLSLTDNQKYPAAVIRILGAGVAGSDTSTVSPSVSVRLILERSDTADQKMDGAFRAAHFELQGLQVKDATGHTWSRLKLSTVRDLPLADGYAGCELIFDSSSDFKSKHCEC